MKLLLSNIIVANGIEQIVYPTLINNLEDIYEIARDGRDANNRPIIRMDITINDREHYTYTPSQLLALLS